MTTSTLHQEKFLNGKMPAKSSRKALLVFFILFPLTFDFD
jgi:hypothetical protein